VGDELLIDTNALVKDGRIITHYDDIIKYMDDICECRGVVA
jgi:hypothetical protein